MKKVLVLLLATISLYSIQPRLLPLWEEDEHFLQYRFFMIKSAIYRLENIAKTLDEESQERFHWDLEMLKFYLGLASEIETVTTDGSDI